jgi:hypothetical protein
MKHNLLAVLAILHGITHARVLDFEGKDATLKGVKISESTTHGGNVHGDKAGDLGKSFVC